MASKFIFHAGMNPAWPLGLVAIFMAPLGASGAVCRGRAAPPEQSSLAQVLITQVLNNAKWVLLGLVNFVWGTASLREVYYCLIACKALARSQRHQPARQNEEAGCNA